MIATSHKSFDLEKFSLRHFPMRIFINMPTIEDRYLFFKKNLEFHSHGLNNQNLIDISVKTENFSVSELKNLLNCALLESWNRVQANQSSKQHEKNVSSPLIYENFISSMAIIRPLYLKKLLNTTQNWNQMYGVLPN